MIKKIDVKKLRRSIGMSQSDFANRLGISRPTLIKIEKGERKITIAEKGKIEEIFGLADIEKNNSDIRINIPQKRLDKFKEVLLYVLEKTAGKPNVGMTVLYKLLYFIDFDYYEKYEEQLMGLTYFKNHHGPTPREFMSVVDEMKKNGELEEVKSAYFTFDQRKFLPYKRADIGKLNGKELKMIDDVIARYGDKSARELSDLSHEDMPWVVAETRQNLEYDHVFYRPEKLSVREYEEL